MMDSGLNLGMLVWASAGAIAVMLILALVLLIVPLCKVFAKMGNRWYEAIINGHNAFVLITNAGRPGRWFFVPVLSALLFVLTPMVPNNSIRMILMIVAAAILLYVYFSVCIGLAQRFGKGAGFGVGLAILPFIFYPILGYGNATYMRMK